MKNPLDKSSDNTEEYNENSCQTRIIAVRALGVHHTEGGWPKEINLNELRTRFLSKIEKEELFTDQVYELATAAESQVMQNIAVNIYSQYFEYEDDATEQKEDTMMTKCVFRDPEQVGCIIIFSSKFSAFVVKSQKRFLLNLPVTRGGRFVQFFSSDNKKLKGFTVA